MDQAVSSLLDSLKTYAELPLEEIRTLEPEHYTSPELYALEIEHIWKKEWICVAHLCQLKKPGDFIAFDLMNEPMMVVRGEDMVVRALSTVCRHRFMPVVRHADRGNASRFQCPYHRWTYGLDGRLNQALYMEENRCFDMQKVRLPEFRLEIWNDLVWVNLDDEAEPLAPRLSDLDERFKVFQFSEADDWEAPVLYDEVWPANWKLCIENNEAYHTMGVHTDTLEPYVPTQNIQKATHGEHWVSIEDLYATERQVTQDMLKRLDWKPGDMGQEVPNLNIVVISPANGFTISPGGAGWFTHWPISINRTRAFMTSAGPSRYSTPVDDPRDSGLYKVLEQDRFAFEAGIGRGVYSSKVEAGPLSWMEELVLRGHQWTARRLLEAVG